MKIYQKALHHRTVWPVFDQLPDELKQVREYLLSKVNPTPDTNQLEELQPSGIKPVQSN